MPESDSFWDFYWEVRLREMENLGKREAILAASRLIRNFESINRPVRLIEPGCGEGQIIGSLVEGHANICPANGSVGIDYSSPAIEKCRSHFPAIRFVEGDFTDPALLASFGKFDIVLLVNALHEVFSFTYSEELGEVDLSAARQRVKQALTGAVQCLAPGGYVVLFDGLERTGDPQEKVRLRFCNLNARKLFDIFVREYRPFRISFREIDGPLRIELSWFAFTRYMTKSIFLGKPLWETERLESYQYFTQADFENALEQNGLQIRYLRTFIENEEKWARVVEIETPGVSFPEEHILILAQLPDAMEPGE